MATPQRETAQNVSQTSNPCRKILVIHAIFSNTRKTILDHLYCYPNYKPGNLYVYHHAFAPITNDLIRFPFDVIIIDYCFLAYRGTELYGELREKYKFLRDSSALKIVISQDEFNFNEILDDWLEFIKVDVIYTPVTRDLDVLFPRCSTHVPIKHALAGYSDPNDLARLSQFVLPFAARKIDVGTRVRYTPMHAGRAGILKGEMAEKFRDAAQAAGFAVDISTRPEDVFTGDDWFAFLGACRFTFATRAGASVPDPRGEIRKRVAAFLEAKPSATFEEVEAACFPGSDRYDFSCVSPRMFEAAAARSGLILVEDDYFDGFEPYRHYIPLKADFSNISEVFQLMRDDSHAQEMIEAAHEFLVRSERFSYATFVNDVMGYIELQVPTPRAVGEEDFAKLTRHFAALQGSQRLLTEAPPHWAKVARYAGIQAQRQGQLEALTRLLAAKRRVPDLRSIAAAEIATTRELDRTVTGLAVEAINGLAKDDRDLDSLVETLNMARRPGFENFQRDWPYCEYIYDPLPATDAPSERNR